MKRTLRQIRSAPGIALVAILSVALGIGGTTAIYSVLHAVIIDPYPYRDPERIIRYVGLLPVNAMKQLQKVDALETVIATDFYNMNLSDGDLPQSVNAARLSPNAFEFFQVPALLGREFLASDSPEGQEPEHAAVLSYDFWRRQYNGDRNVIGRSVTLDSVKYTVIGVVPPRFQWRDCDVFLPANLAFFNFPILEVHARLRSGVTWEQAQAQLMAFMKSRVPNAPSDYKLPFRRVIDDLRSNLQSTLVLFTVAVFVLLAVGCANVSILSLARGAARQRELAVRVALGASRRQIARELIAESLLLTVVGGIVGVLLAFVLLNAILRWVPNEAFPPETDIHINGPVLLLTATTVIVVGIVSGLAPMIRLSQPDANTIIQGSLRATAAPRGRILQHTFVSAQIALSTLLLVGSATAMRNLISLHRTSLGYDPSGVVRFTVPTPEGSYPEYAARKAVFQNIVNRTALIPGVEAAAITGSFTPPLLRPGGTFETFGMNSDSSRRASLQGVSEDYFEVFRIPLIRGRIWSSDETERAAAFAVINEQAARQLWPNGNPIGAKIRFPNNRGGLFSRAAPWSNDWLEIIGVVGNTPSIPLRELAQPAAYTPYTLLVGDNLSLVIRATKDLAAVTQQVRTQVHLAAPGQAIGPNVQTADEILRSIGWEREQFIAILTGTFAMLTVILSAVGLYSTVSYTTALRRKEFGIRIALGARKLDVIRLVTCSTMWTVISGVIAGLVLTFWSHSALSAWSPMNIRDPWVLTTVPILMAFVVAAATYFPARRALAVDPIGAVKSD